jgi:hypothetical protein
LIHHPSESNTITYYSSLQSQTNNTIALVPRQTYPLVTNAAIKSLPTKERELSRRNDWSTPEYRSAFVARAIDIGDRIAGTTSSGSSLAPLKTAQLPDKTTNVLICAGGPERQHYYEWHTG